MSDTPKTDDAEDTCRNCGLSFVLSDDARKIERELAVELERNALHERNIALLNKIIMDERGRIEQLQRELTKALLSPRAKA